MTETFAEWKERKQKHWRHWLCRTCKREFITYDDIEWHARCPACQTILDIQKNMELELCSNCKYHSLKIHDHMCYHPDVMHELEPTPCLAVRERLCLQAELFQPKES